MPWDATILEQFRLISRVSADESQYYGPYITLLTNLFPHTEHYQLSLGPAAPRSIDLTIVHIIPQVGLMTPVLPIEIQPHTHLHDLAMREKADNRMRDRFRELNCPDHPLRKIYGISVMGTRFAVYEYMRVTNRIAPPSIPRDPDIVNDVAPKARWEYDLLDPDGGAKFRSIVAKVKAIVEH